MSFSEPTPELEALRLERPRLLGGHGAFRTYAGEGSRVAVVLGQQARVAAAQATFDAVVEAHERCTDPRVPRPLARTPMGIVFACSATRDLASLLLERQEERLTAGAYLALIDQLASALLAAHGAAVATGALSFASVLLDEEGNVHLVTLGKNLAIVRENGSLRAGRSSLAAPEVLAGALPMPCADTFALVALSRALLPHVALPPGMMEALAGQASKATAFLAWESTAVVGASPAQRAPLADWHERLLAAWAELGIAPDRAALGRRTTEQATPISPEGTSDGWALAADGSTFRGEDGREAVIPARSPLRRILGFLVARWREGGSPCTVYELGEVGWPGEQPIPEAIANRVYVAIATLRKLGLRSLIVRSDAGYSIDKRRPVRIL